MSFSGMIDLKYKECKVAYGFKNWDDFLEWYSDSNLSEWDETNNIYLSTFKPKNNHKGELVFQRGGARVALCCMENELDHIHKNCCKVNVESLKDGSRIFYADQRVIGSEIHLFAEYMREKISKGTFDKNEWYLLPKVRYPLSDAERKQRVDAGRKRIDELSEKDEIIKQLEARIKELEIENKKLKQKKAPIPITFDIEEEEEEKQFEI